jgi:hypothetical protein
MRVKPAWPALPRGVRTSVLSTARRQRLRGVDDRLRWPLKRNEAGPEARLVEALLLIVRDYQARLVGQPPLVLVRVQERVTTPVLALAIVNVLPVLAVTTSE